MTQKLEYVPTEGPIDKDVPTLVSFALCPFVQRSVITLKVKGKPFHMAYIDLEKPPTWFLEAVPTAKVPALFVDDTVLFESAVINEYIDESFGARLQELSTLDRARERAWIRYVEELVMDQYRLLTAETQSDFQAHKQSLFQRLGVLSGMAGARFFSGDAFGLLDAAIAPVFMRLKLMPAVYRDLESEFGAHHRLFSWIENLMQMDEVRDSVVEDFEVRFYNYFEQAGVVSAA